MERKKERERADKLAADGGCQYVYVRVHVCVRAGGRAGVRAGGQVTLSPCAWCVGSVVSVGLSSSSSSSLFYINIYLGQFVDRAATVALHGERMCEREHTEIDRRQPREVPRVLCECRDKGDGLRGRLPELDVVVENPGDPYARIPRPNQPTWCNGQTPQSVSSSYCTDMHVPHMHQPAN